MGNKYQPNSENLFDCPAKRCSRKGKEGFSSPQAVGVHFRHNHATKVRKTRVARSPVPPESNGNGTLIRLALTLWEIPAIHEATSSELQDVFQAVIARKAFVGTTGTSLAGHA